MKVDYKELHEAPVSEGTQTEGDNDSRPRVEEISEEEYKAMKAKGKSQKGDKSPEKKSNNSSDADMDDID